MTRILFMCVQQLIASWYEYGYTPMYLVVWQN